MTPEYIYKHMTWHEISDALSYVNMYEQNERHYAIKPFNKNKKLWDWWKRDSETVDAQMRKMFRNMKSSGVK